MGVKINIVDTPGHADFGGEVERILRMVDGVLILVDAAEGPMPQTRFVTRKALALGLRPIVAINKIDRADAEPLRVHDEVLGLFIDLEATHEQLDAPFLYTSSRVGTATTEIEHPGKDLTPLFQAILDHVPEPKGDPDGPFQMLVSTLDFSNFLGRIAIGRVERGRVRVGDQVALLPLGEPGLVTDEAFERNKVTTALYVRRPPPGRGRLGIGRRHRSPLGFRDDRDREDLHGGRYARAARRHRRRGADDLGGLHREQQPLRRQGWQVRHQPAASRSPVSRARAQRRAPGGGDRQPRHPQRLRAWRAHLGILMETMRREGYEFQVSRPRVITRLGPDGERLEPYEELTIDVAEEYMGVVMEKLGPRRSEMTEMRNPGQGMVRLTFRIPARGLFGYRSDFLTDTRGNGVMHHRFLDYGPWAGPLAGRKRGVLVADREGSVVAFALGNLQERAQMFVTPGDLVYEGMIAGESSRPGDMDVNVTKEKKLTNMRTTASDENVILEPPRQITLEYALEYIEEDELIEVTPRSIRLRKRVLTANDRKKAARAARVADAS